MFTRNWSSNTKNLLKRFNQIVSLLSFPNLSMREVEPAIEFWEAKPQEYLEFLEKCTRVCYKSENRIGPGSAEKLLQKVVREYEHYSVTEHFNIILKIKNIPDYNYYRLLILESNPLFADRMSVDVNDESGPCLIISGNIRMWAELLKNMSVYSDSDHYTLSNAIEHALSVDYPFFFPLFGKLNDTPDSPIHATVLDSNFITNYDKLTAPLLLKHTTATFKFTCSRACSHQLVRHRKFAFSQESQRYVNYNKRGFQYIKPNGLWDKSNNFRSIVYREFAAYTALINAGIKPEVARYVLPNATKTEVVVTGTLDYWLNHVIPHRGHNPKAQKEIRELCLDVEECLKGMLEWYVD